MTVERPAPRYAPELILLPVAMSVRQSNLLTLALIAVAGLLALRRRPISTSSPGPLLLLLAVSAVVFRSGDSPRTFAIIAGVAAVATISGRRHRLPVAVSSLMLGVVVYMWANVAAWLVGVQSPAAAVRIGGFESSSGLFGGERIIWPLTRSINEAPIVAAMLLTYLAAVYVQEGRLRRWHWVGVAGAAVILLGANSRFPLLVAAVVVAGTLLAPVVTRRVLLPVGLAAMSAPFYVAAVSTALLSVAGLVAQVPYLARGQSVDQLAGLGTRGEIWERGMYWWVHHADTTAWVFGFGENGHATSGAVYLYYRLFGGFVSNPTALTLHNTFLQTLYDAGLVGVVLLAVALGWTLVRYQRAGVGEVVVALGAVYLTAAVEVTLSPGFTSTPFLLVLTLAAVSPLCGHQFGVDPDAGRGEVGHGDRGREVGLSGAVGGQAGALRHRSRRYA